MKFFSFVALQSSLLSVLALVTSRSSWSNVPLYTDGRWIVDSDGINVTYAGANWPGAADTMLPEGLQYASASDTMAKIKSLGMNVIRLTFAIEMIDQIYENGGQDISIKDALIEALGTENGTIVLKEILAKNPSFTNQTTRLQVFDSVASAAAEHGIYVHLDNHMSKAEWCCSTDDGNAWFNDTYFDVPNWKRGLSYMVNHAKQWPSFVSIGMRNEPREPDDGSTTVEPYDWPHWYSNMVSAAYIIHETNPDPLIFFSGLDFDTKLGPITLGESLSNSSSLAFNASSFPFSDKLVFEIHNYYNDATNCSEIYDDLYYNGYDALDLSNHTVKNHVPVVMTEFGFAQDNTTYLEPYASCLREMLPEWKAGWITWVLAGSYYIRDGSQDFDETWGLLNHNWTTWRSPAAIYDGLVPMINATLA